MDVARIWLTGFFNHVQERQRAACTKSKVEKKKEILKRCPTIFVSEVSSWSLEVPVHNDLRTSCHIACTSRSSLAGNVDPGRLEMSPTHVRPPCHSAVWRETTLNMSHSVMSMSILLREHHDTSSRSFPASSMRPQRTTRGHGPDATLNREKQARVPMDQTLTPQLFVYSSGSTK